MTSQSVLSGRLSQLITSLTTASTSPASVAEYALLLSAIWPSGILLAQVAMLDRKSTRLNSSHTVISYAVFCLKKKKWRSDMCWMKAPVVSQATNERGYDRSFNG